MAPNRRGKHDHHGGGAVPAHNNNQRNGHGRMATVPLKCVRPKGCLDPKRLIFLEDIESGSIEVVRVACNNLQCEQGNYMHTECFNDWEESVLNFLSSTGRARSWSVKQRQQNLWTKKGYDLAFKACDCNCGKGHLRKDLDWIPPTEKLDRARQNAGPPANPPQAPQEDVPAPVQNANPQVVQPNYAAVAAAAVTDKKKKKKAKEALPTLALSAPVFHPNDNHNRKVAATPINNSSAPKPVSASSEGGSIGIGSFGSDHSTSPSPPSVPPSWNAADASYRARVNSVSSNASSGAFSGSSGSPPSPGAQFGFSVSANSLAQNIFKFQRKNSTSTTTSGGGAVGGERTRHNSLGGGSGGATTFSRRSDFSSFNFLPKQRQNSYHIKMDEDGHGNEDTRFTILAALQNQRMTKVNCGMCQTGMTIYDRYPLVDGTFFVSPRKYFKDTIPITSAVSPCSDGVSTTRYLTALCMHCLSGKNGGFVCRSCGRAFDGTTVVLGGCYSYDIFAAAGCCRKKSECGNCRALPASRAPQFFSETSRLSRCNRCGYTDYHYAKPLETAYERYPSEQFQKYLAQQKWDDMWNALPSLSGNTSPVAQPTM